MNTNEKKLLENYRKLIAGNQQIALSNIQVMTIAQENTKWQYGLDGDTMKPPEAKAREAV
jgi:hypothetical protein